MKRAIFSVLIALLALPLFAQDPAKVGANVYNCVLENERIRICEIKFKPGDRIAMHSHPDHAVYVVAPGRIKITNAAGKVSDLDFKAGQSAWIPAEAHWAVNTGSTELRGVVIELKETDPVKSAILQMERDWANAMMRGDMATMDRIVASDWTLTDPMGYTHTRAQAMADLRSGDLKFESTIPGDVQVRVYGDTAIVTGMTTDRGSYKGMDISGDYRFTDVFVNRDGKWQAVSTHVTKVMPMQQ